MYKGMSRFIMTIKQAYEYNFPDTCICYNEVIIIHDVVALSAKFENKKLISS